MLAHDMALAEGGEFLLRIEDIDQSRARAEWESQIYDDLHWLGIDWPVPVMRQSDRMDTYATALDQLWNAELLYPCTCTRRDIAAAASAPQEGAPMGPDGIIYPGTCRNHDRHGPRPADAVLRLDVTRAAREVRYIDQSEITVQADTFINDIGDVVLARRDMGTSYHLSVVVDDAAQGITDVVRGADLAEATPIHVLLQHLLGLPTPTYHHHRLFRDEAGKRLAKRDDARAIAKYRAEGATADDIRRLVGLPLP